MRPLIIGKWHLDVRCSDHQRKAVNNYILVGQSAVQSPCLLWTDTLVINIKSLINNYIVNALLKLCTCFWLHAIRYTLQAIKKEQFECTWRPFCSVVPDWCNKGGGMCYPVCDMVHIKEPLLLIGRIAHVAAAGFLSHYQSGTLPYVRRHVTVNKMCWVHR